MGIRIGYRVIAVRRPADLHRDVIRKLGLLTRRIAFDPTGRNVQRAGHRHERRGIIIAVAFLDFKKKAFHEILAFLAGQIGLVRIRKRFS
ncbi:hypothetical protein D3C73_1108250 [compost metagenome]